MAMANTSASIPQRTPSHRGSGMRQVYDWQDFKAGAKRARKKIRKYGKKAGAAVGDAWDTVQEYTSRENVGTAAAAPKKKKSRHGGRAKGAGMPLKGY